MKQRISLILSLIFALCVFGSAFAEESASLEIKTNIKNTVVENGIRYKENAVFLSLREVCEALGSLVYTAGNEYLIISRDGDVAVHTLGSDSFILNGETHFLSVASEADAFVPCEMLEKLYGIVLSGREISREMQTNSGNELVKDVVKFCFNGNFYPENFSRYLKYHIENPDIYMGSVINSVNIGLDKKWHEDAEIVGNPDDTLVLVNKLNRLPEDYEAPELSTVYCHYVKGSREYLLNTEAYYKFVDMYDAAAKEGLRLKIVSAYRTEDYQRQLYDTYYRYYGAEYAEIYSAQPGYSEHQTGFAVDINSLETSFEHSREYKWLKENAHKYGFIERYKKGAEHITGYAYEPWHYRYVGIDAATAIYNEGITYEEYYCKYVYKSKYTADNDRIWANVIRYYYLKNLHPQVEIFYSVSLKRILSASES